jgi:hypothetical protein
MPESNLFSPLPSGERMKVRGSKKDVLLKATLTLALFLNQTT